MEDLYQGEEIEGTEEYIEIEKHIESDSLGPEILRSKFTKYLKELSGKKAMGVDNIPAEILKNIGEKTEDLLFAIIKECYCNSKVSL